MGPTGSARARSRTAAFTVHMLTSRARISMLLLPLMEESMHTNGIPGTTFAGQECVGAGRAIRAGGIGLRLRGIGTFAGRDQRVHDFPGTLDLVAAHEQGGVPVDGILQETLGGFGNRE